jgi:hypothetical protein
LSIEARGITKMMKKIQEVKENNKKKNTNLATLALWVNAV